MWTNSEFPKGSAQKGGLKTCHVCTKPANLFSSKTPKGGHCEGKQFRRFAFSLTWQCVHRLLRTGVAALLSQIPLPEKYIYIEI